MSPVITILFRKPTPPPKPNLEGHVAPAANRPPVNSAPLKPPVENRTHQTFLESLLGVDPLAPSPNGN